MPTCVIRPVKHNNSFRWKWRHTRADGTVKESEEAYDLFYECVLAARESGFEPQLKPLTAQV